MVNNHLGPDNAQTGPDYDPVNLMAQIFAEIQDFKGPAQDILLSWILRLPGKLSPDEAAQKVMADIVSRVHAQDLSPSSEGNILIELLCQTIDHKMETVISAANDRRRGGRAARLKT